MRIKEKIGNFVDENDKIIATTGCVLFTLGVGYALGCKHTQIRIGLVLKKFLERIPKLKHSWITQSKNLIKSKI